MDRFFRGIASNVKKAGKAIIGVFTDKSIGVQIGSGGTKVEVLSDAPVKVAGQEQQYDSTVPVSDFSGMLPYLAIGVLAYLVLK